MDSVSCSSGSRQAPQGPPEQAGRLHSSWVTFDDDNAKAARRDSATGEGPSSPGLDNTPLPPPHGLRDGNSNHVVARTRSQHRGQNGSPAAAGALLDLAAGGGGGGVPYAEKNPFFNEAFDDVKPSAINPFSSFFDGGEKVKQWSRADSGGGGHMDLGPDSVSPARPPQNPREMGEPGGPRGPRASDPPDLDDEGVEEGEEALEEPAEDEPYLPAHMAPREGWPMLLRIPEKKNIMSSRHWGPIYARLTDDGFLRLFYERGVEKPFRSLRLRPQHEVSEHRLQSYDDAGRVHTLSVDLLQYRERRRLPARLPLGQQLQQLQQQHQQHQHQLQQPAAREQLVKLATSCYGDFLSFRHALLELLRRLPEDPPDSPASAAGGGGPPGALLQPEEEVHVEVRDEFYGAVGEGDGRIVEQLVVTRVNVLALLWGRPRCQLGLNDIQVKGKELVSRHHIIPNTTARWIRLQDARLHAAHADADAFAASRALVFAPPPRQRFQLLCFRTPFAERALPFTLRTVASVRGAEVCVQSWLLMAPSFTPNRDPLAAVPCENVVVRYPIPELWAKNFRREGVIGEKSLKARFNKGASFGSAGASGAEPAMRVTLGAAKYEQAFKAVVWRMPRLPDKNSALGHPHTFFCRLELGSDQEVPRALERHLEVEFDMPAAAASKTTVRSLSVDDRPDVKKWINYKSHFLYQVPIEQKSGEVTEAGNMPADQPGECAHQ